MLHLSHPSVRRRRRPRASRQRGSVAVEFALVVPLLTALLLGVVTAGYAYNNVLGVAQGVREGARYGATVVDSLTWAADVQSRTVAAASLNASAFTNSQVCTQLVQVGTPDVVKRSSSGCTLGSAPADPSGVTAGTCLVKVWASIPVKLNFVIYQPPVITVKRQSVSVYERANPC